MSQNDILFVHVEPGDEKLDPGDWFFDTDGWWLCGQTGQEEDGRWYLVGVPTRANQSPHDEGIKFASLADVPPADIWKKYFDNKPADMQLFSSAYDEIIGRCEPGEVGHSLQVPHDDACLHLCQTNERTRTWTAADSTAA